MTRDLSATVRRDDAAELMFPLKGAKGPVALIALWSGEQLPPTQVVSRSGGLGYADENPNDRDERGVLWSRELYCPGVGEPLYDKVHTLRQRVAMRVLLCQVCGGPADHDARGTLWLLRDERGEGLDWPENYQSAQPPLCLRCARVSVRFCPWLKSYVAVRAHSRLFGVSGLIYQPTNLFPKVAGHGTFGYHHPLRKWVQASQLIRTLHDCTIVEL